MMFNETKRDVDRDLVMTAAGLARRASGILHRLESETKDLPEWSKAISSCEQARSVLLKLKQGIEDH